MRSMLVCGNVNPHNRGFTCGLAPGHGGRFHRFAGEGTMTWPIQEMCKWCREPIKRSELDGFDEVAWVHLSGLYTCPMHPETFAEPADIRWDFVYAYVGPVRYDNLSEWEKKQTEYRIDVIYKGLMHSTIHRVHKDQRGRAEFDFDKQVMIQMIEHMDEILDELDKESGEDD